MRIENLMIIKKFRIIKLTNGKWRLKKWLVKNLMSRKTDKEKTGE